MVEARKWAEHSAQYQLRDPELLGFDAIELDEPERLWLYPFSEAAAELAIVDREDQDDERAAAPGDKD
jgi:hypothetical protein